MSESGKPRLIVFDMDGTLIDSQGFITATISTVFAAEGLPPPNLDDARRMIGLSLEETMGFLGNVSGAARDSLVAAYRAQFRARAVAGNGLEEQLYPGCLETLGRLHADPRNILGIATGKSLRGVHRIIELYGLGEYFTTLQTPDNNPSKPHPGMVLTAMQETGVAPEQAVVIGDTTFDIEMAVAAGVAAIGVSWGYHEIEELFAAGASVIIDDYAQLDEAVNKILD